jgi:hypothetical protein
MEISDAECAFLRNSVSVDFGCGQPFGEVQSEFDCFYNLATCPLDTFYPERTITVTSRDPPFVTADLKAKLRHKNRLMRCAKVVLRKLVRWRKLSETILDSNSKTGSAESTKSLARSPRVNWQINRQGQLQS